jgi:hypothetical protein
VLRIELLISKPMYFVSHPPYGEKWLRLVLVVGHLLSLLIMSVNLLEGKKMFFTSLVIFVIFDKTV